MLRVPTRERAGRGPNADVIIEMRADPGIVQARRRHHQ
jgi:hypothetical protein